MHSDVRAQIMFLNVLVSFCRTSVRISSCALETVCCALLADEVDVGRKTRKRKTPSSAAGKRKTRGAMTSSRVPKSFQRLLEEVSSCCCQRANAPASILCSRSAAVLLVVTGILPHVLEMHCQWLLVAGLAVSALLSAPFKGTRRSAGRVQFVFVLDTVSHLQPPVSPGATLCWADLTCAGLRCGVLSCAVLHYLQSGIEDAPEGDVNYLTAAAGPSMAYAARKFCSVCGFNSA
jgi:hypothetical protein